MCKRFVGHDSESNEVKPHRRAPYPEEWAEFQRESCPIKQHDCPDSGFSSFGNDVAYSVANNPAVVNIRAILRSIRSSASLRFQQSTGMNRSVSGGRSEVSHWSAVTRFTSCVLNVYSNRTTNNYALNSISLIKNLARVNPSICNICHQYCHTCNV